MEKKNLLFFRKWFRSYVRSYYSKNSLIMRNIKLKEDHSWRVCSNAIRIARSEVFSMDDLYLAQSIAIFHDIGRFEQFSRYGTFRDSESEDHASLGVRIMNSEAVLSRLDGHDQDVIYFAVENHNKLQIPDNANERCMLHSRLIRDADKLDIFKVFIEEFAARESSPNPALYMGLPDREDYSGSIIEDIFNNTLSSMTKVKSYNDLNLTRLTWLYDMNFTESFRLIKKRDYIGKVIETLPSSAEMDSVRSHLEEYLDSKLT